jgi:hypothetical protein
VVLALCPTLLLLEAGFLVPVMVGRELRLLLLIDELDVERVAGLTYSLLERGCCEGRLRYAFGLLYLGLGLWFPAELFEVVLE